MRKLVLILAMLAVTAVGLAACGGDDDSGGSESAATEAPADGDGSGGASGSQAELSADPGGQLAYEQSSLSARGSAVDIAFTNTSAIPHDVRVEDGDGNVLGGTDVFAEGAETASLDLEPGEYTFFCSVPGHRQSGMEGSLTVE